MNSPLAFSSRIKTITSGRHGACCDEAGTLSAVYVSSELVALSGPVEPVLDRLPGFVISIDHFELGERNRQTFPVPAHHDEHLVLALLFGRHADHLDLISSLQWGDGSPGSTPGEKGEVELPFDIVVPTQYPFLLIENNHDNVQ